MRKPTQRAEVIVRTLMSRTPLLYIGGIGAESEGSDGVAHGGVGPLWTEKENGSFRHQPGQDRVEPGEPAVELRDVGVQVLHQQGAEAAAVVGLGAGEHLVEDHPGAVEIGARVRARAAGPRSEAALMQLERGSTVPDIRQPENA